jgi:hypothetical protein
LRWGEIDVEPFAAYADRVSGLLPNFPAPVLEQWLHRHFPDVASRFDWALDELTFRMESWSLEQIVDDVRAWEGVRNWTDFLLNEAQDGYCFLERYMVEHGTWPTPIIVLPNTRDFRLSNGYPLERPVHLVEGHRRLGFLHALLEHPDWTPAREHDLYVIDPETVRLLS